MNNLCNKVHVNSSAVCTYRTRSKLDDLGWLQALKSDSVDGGEEREPADGGRRRNAKEWVSTAIRLRKQGLGTYS